MEREFLFRGKTKETNEWVYGGVFVQDGRHFIVKEITYECGTKSWGAFEVDPKTVGQFIGKVDKRGNQIFEDDLCLMTYPVAIETGKIKELGVSSYVQATHLGICKYYEYATAFECVNKHGRVYRFFNSIKASDDCCDYAEVVGNVYDNPEYICPVCRYQWKNSNTLADGKEPCRACGEFI